MIPVAQSLLGLVLIPLAAWALSENRRAFTVRQVLTVVTVGLALQASLAALLLNVPSVRAVFAYAEQGVAALQAATNEGMQLVFGYLAGGTAPFEAVRPESVFVLAFQGLPVILIVSVLSRLLYHWGILQRIVAGFAWALRKTMGVSGPLGTATAANIFVGMVEAPLLIRPYLATMSRSALFGAMTAGMATVAGTVLVLYATLLEPSLPGAAGHLIVASVMSAPAAVAIARLMVPPEPDELSAGAAPVDGQTEAQTVVNPDDPYSAMDAIARGTLEGLKLLAYVAAMLVVMVALVALINSILALVTEPFGVTITLQRALGWLAAPFAFIIGIPWSEAALGGELLGIKVVLNELLAYLRLAEVPADALSERSRLILTYAMCGFANFGSLGIMIGGLVALVPERRADIVALGPKTIVSGMLTTLMTGAVVGALTPG